VVTVQKGKLLDKQHLNSLENEPDLPRSCTKGTGRQGRAIEMIRLNYLGLPNPSNHCFINALLQCLFSLEGLKSRLERVRDGNLAADRLYKLFCAIESQDRSHLKSLKNELFDSIVRAMNEVNIMKKIVTLRNLCLDPNYPRRRWR